MTLAIFANDFYNSIPVVTSPLPVYGVGDLGVGFIRNQVYSMDALAFLLSLPEASVHCIITSPPYYGLRSYLPDGHPDKPAEIGLEETPEQYIDRLVTIFMAAHRVLHPSGVFWLNLGDSYWTAKGQSGHASFEKQSERLAEGDTISQPHAHIGGNGVTIPKDRPHEVYKAKDLMLLPHRVAIALQAAGWYLRSAIPWVKSNPMPERVGDRPTNAHEYWFMFTKSKHYFADPDAVRKPNSAETLKRVMRGRSSDHKYAAGDYYPDKVSRHTMNRPVEYRGYDNMEATVAAGETYLNPNGRNIRTSDFWETSLDDYEARLQAQLEHVRHVRANGGLLLSEDNEPLSLMVSTKSFKGAHFATFPPDLVEPLLKFSCPGKVCSCCGNPYKRVVDTKSSVIKKSDRKNKLGKYGRTSASGTMVQLPTREYHGWQPTCKCNAEAKKGVVLDMFGGSGTVARVAVQNSRDYIINELNPDYVAIIKDSLRLPLEKPIIQKQSKPLEELPLFANLPSAPTAGGEVLGGEL